MYLQGEKSQIIKLNKRIVQHNKDRFILRMVVWLVVNMNSKFIYPGASRFPVGRSS